MSAAYPKLKAGEKVVIPWRKEDFMMCCCDCLLVHRMRFTVAGGQLTIRAWRDNRATAQLRRHRKVSRGPVI